VIHFSPGERVIDESAKRDAGTPSKRSQALADESLESEFRP
jgi:hypothetical protein